MLIKVCNPNLSPGIFPQPGKKVIMPFNTDFTSIYIKTLWPLKYQSVKMNFVFSKKVCYNCEIWSTSELKSKGFDQRILVYRTASFGRCIAAE